MTYRIQEVVSRTGRVHVFAAHFDNLRRAYIAMRSYARLAQHGYRKWDYSKEPETFVETASLETDNDTHITVVTQNNARRRFTIVEKRNGPPVLFNQILMVDKEGNKK